MKRDINKYAELGLKKIADNWHYELSVEEGYKSKEIYEAGLNATGSTLDAAMDVAMYFYHAGIETGCRYSRNKKA